MISNTVLREFKKHVLETYPNEACGVVIGDKYYPCKNEHPEPTKAFRIGIERFNLEKRHGPVEAVLHSHPYSIEESASFPKYYDPAWPTVPDQAGFIADTVPWGILSTDGQGVSPLTWMSDEPIPVEGRKFAWFTSDCFACMRDWYHSNTNLRIPNFTREWEFWTKGVNTIEDGVKTIPFAKRIPLSQAKVGDTVLMTISSKVINHIAVITDTNEILHQFVGRYANFDSWSKWRGQAAYCVRFES